MRLGANLPGPFYVSGNVNTNPYQTECKAGGVVHANGAIASRCQDCQRWYAWAASPGGQEWLRLEREEHSKYIVRSWLQFAAIATVVLASFLIMALA